MSSGRQLSPPHPHPNNPPKAKELESMKESISDIINQLQDIDPSRLSFSPFLDLDTQIVLAPVSDSPESSVEELHSPCCSVSGSTPSLEPLPNSQHKSLPRNYQRPINNNTLPKGPPPDESPSAHPHAPPVSPAPSSENCTSTPRRDPLPNGTDPARWSPEPSPRLDCSADDSTRPLISPSARPLVGPAPESVELNMWTSQAPVEARPAPGEDAHAGKCCWRCACCRRGRVPALLSVLGSVLCSVGVMYALYFHVPLKPPRFSDVTGRMVFTLCCCAVASVPILLAMMVGALCQFCSGSLDLHDPSSTRRSLQQIFISSSLELLLLYGLNMLILCALLPHEHLMMVPVMAVMFVLGRLVYWVSLNVCSPWRGFGSGLTVFPLLASVALNLFLMYNTLHTKQALFGS
ncbi:transmembrane protein 79-like [Boleophthalmus pectinirostris]|uniref:transmembrane protein 79-like n=1 Tax=Boleophthalmus pectinirostris TaxID=150288 RepID=UPI00243177F7|nr:transmembrane protein 79-like [Boleophthalmus pectinirostris]